MGFLSFLKSSDKALSIVDKGTTGVIAGIDKLFFTDEEKSEASLKVTEAHLKLVEATAGENSKRSITRRILAVMIMGSFLALLLFGAGIHRWDPDWSKHVLTCASALSTLALTIGIFYFGSYGIKSIFPNVGNGKKK